MVFLSTSLILAFFTLYSANTYIRVYETTRNFNVLTPDFKVTVFNGSYASTETTLNLVNPSTSKFELLQILEGIRLNDAFITNGRFSASNNPVEIHPMSNVSITIEADIPSYRILHVTSQIQRTWFIDVRITLSAEIVGTFSWRRTWLIAGI